MHGAEAGKTAHSYPRAGADIHALCGKLGCEEGTDLGYLARELRVCG